MNGRFRFVVLRPSGVVVSERALKSVRGMRLAPAVLVARA
jgi:hypothetical protein